MKRFTAIATVALVMATIVGCGGETTDTANAVQTEKIEKVETLTLSKEMVARELELSSTLEGYTVRRWPFASQEMSLHQ